MESLHVYRNKVINTVIAASPEDASQVEYSYHVKNDMDADEAWTPPAEWELVPPSKLITIDLEGDGDLTSMTAAEWVKCEGRGFLCTTEYLGRPHMTDDFSLSPDAPPGRQEDDFYPTPPAVTEALWNHAHHIRGPDVRIILDPCCGDGALLDVLSDHKRATVGIEINPGRATVASRRGHLVTTGDALATDMEWKAADAVVMNPPYKLADQFMHKAMDWSRASGEAPVYSLMRITYLEPTRARRSLLLDYTPDVLILSSRPSFVGRGTDSTTSAWFCWPGDGKLVWLP